MRVHENSHSSNCGFLIVEPKGISGKSQKIVKKTQSKIYSVLRKSIYSLIFHTNLLIKKKTTRKVINFKNYLYTRQ